MYRYFDEIHEVLLVTGLLVLGCVIYYVFHILRFLSWQKRLTASFIRDGVLKESDPVYGSANMLFKPDAYIAYSDFFNHFVFWSSRNGRSVVPIEHISEVRFFVERGGEAEELVWLDGEIQERVGGNWESKSVLGIPVLMSIGFHSGGRFEIPIHRLGDLKEWAGRVETSILG